MRRDSLEELGEPRGEVREAVGSYTQWIVKAGIVEKIVVCRGKRTVESVRLNEDDVIREGVRREARWPISDERRLRGRCSGYNSRGSSMCKSQYLEQKAKGWEVEEEEHFLKVGELCREGCNVTMKATKAGLCSLQSHTALQMT